MFPDFTFLHRKTFELGIVTRQQSIAAQKFCNRGWESSELGEESVTWLTSLPGSSIEDGTSRHVGDAKYWAMTLDITDVETPITPDFVLENAHFSVELCKAWPRINPKLFTHAGPIHRGRWTYNYTLRYKYTYGVGFEDFWKFFNIRMTLLEAVGYAPDPGDLFIPTWVADWKRSK